MCTKRKATGEYVLACYLFATMVATAYPTDWCPFDVKNISVLYPALKRPWIVRRYKIISAYSRRRQVTSQVFVFI